MSTCTYGIDIKLPFILHPPNQPSTHTTCHWGMMLKRCVKIISSTFIAFCCLFFDFACRTHSYKKETSFILCEFVSIRLMLWGFIAHFACFFIHFFPLSYCLSHLFFSFIFNNIKKLRLHVRCFHETAMLH